MKSTKPVNPFAPHEVRTFAMPVSLSAILVLAGMAIEVLVNPTPSSMYLIICGIAGIIYIIIGNRFLVRVGDTKKNIGFLTRFLLA